MIEIELRYKVYNAEDLVGVLRANGLSLTSRVTILDQWYIPINVRSREDHDNWFDVEHGIAYRIRKSNFPNGESRVILDSKQLTDDENHNTFKEEVAKIEDETQMRNFLAKNKYYNWLTIDKDRYEFSGAPANLIVSMDTVRGLKEKLGLDTVLEVEYQGNESRDKALIKISEFVETIGLSKTDQFEKSLTVESMQILARFN